MDAVFWNGLAQPRFYVILLGSLAGIGVALAAIGLYGLVSYTVAVRTREFGIRMALGAAPGQILRSVLALGIRLRCVGSLLGLSGALASTRVLSSLLHGVRHNDPPTLAGVALVLAVLAVLASALAARHATSIDPNLALRADEPLPTASSLRPGASFHCR
jgi:putative ABC transport system permease protein